MAAFHSGVPVLMWQWQISFFIFSPIYDKLGQIRMCALSKSWKMLCYLLGIRAIPQQLKISAELKLALYFQQQCLKAKFGSRHRFISSVVHGCLSIVTSVKCTVYCLFTVIILMLLLWPWYRTKSNKNQCCLGARLHVIMQQHGQMRSISHLSMFITMQGYVESMGMVLCYQWIHSMKLLQWYSSMFWI